MQGSCSISIHLTCMSEHILAKKQTWCSPWLYLNRCPCFHFQSPHRLQFPSKRSIAFLLLPLRSITPGTQGVSPLIVWSYFKMYARSLLDCDALHPELLHLALLEPHENFNNEAKRIIFYCLRSIWIASMLTKFTDIRVDPCNLDCTSLIFFLLSSVTCTVIAIT